MKKIQFKIIFFREKPLQFILSVDPEEALAPKDPPGYSLVLWYTFNNF